MAWAADCTSYGSERDRRRGLEVYQAIGRATDITYERRHCLLRAAETARGLADSESLELARSLYGQFLKDYPGAKETERARRGIVDLWIAEKSAERALAWALELETELANGVNFSPELFALSERLMKEEEFDQALTLLAGIAERHPQGPARSRAKMDMAVIYEKLGDEPKMLTVIQEVFPLQGAKAETSLVNAVAYNRAAEFLGQYYMRRKRWEEALTCWRAWRPLSGCGTCTRTMEHVRVSNIMACLLALGRHGEAVQ
jgi:tetratricopeptide (TPR) repeat protein